MFISKPLLFIMGLLYIFALFLNIGQLPLSQNESRYAIAANEMTLNHTLKPTVLGKTYYKQPALYSYFLAASFSIFNTSELSARSVNVFFTLVFGFAILYLLKDIVGVEAGIIAVFGFLVSFGVYFLYAIKSLPNIAYSLFLFFAMLSIFKFNKKGCAPALFFVFLAFLMHGFLAVVSFYLMFFAYVFLNKQLSYYLFSKEHIVSFALFLIGIILWFASVSSGNIHKINYILGFFLLNPITILYNRFTILGAIYNIFKILFYAMPLSMILLLLFNNDFKDEFKNILNENTNINRLFKFGIALLFSVLVYVLFYDSYAAPLVLSSFAVMLSIVFYELEYVDIGFNLEKISTAVYSTLAFIAFVLSVFDYEFINTRDYIFSITALFLSFLFLYLAKAYNDTINRVLVIIAGVGILLKLFYSSVYIPYTGRYQQNYKQIARRISNFILKKNSEYVMSDSGNLRLLFYLEKDLEKPVYCIDSNMKGVVVSKHKNNMDFIEKAVETPEGVYYIGIKNGGV